MSMHGFLPWLLLGLVFSIFTSVFAANAGSGGWLITALCCFAALLVGAGIALNAPFWQKQTPVPGEGLEERLCGASQLNARLMSFGYFWAAAAMAAIYTLTPLDWRHDWQYALGFLVLGVAILTYSALLSARGNVLRRPFWQTIAAALTGVQTVIAAAGSVYLMTGNRLAAARPEWAAHHVFLVGAVLLTILGILALLSFKAINHAERSAHGAGPPHR